MTSEIKHVLITVKTYPHPSNKMKETVCTAGITDDGHWIRMYPIPHRYLKGPNKFRIFDWIEVIATKRPISKDHRPESYSVESSSIKVIGHLDPKRDSIARYGFISQMEKTSLEQVIEEHKQSGASLATIRPHKMIGLTIEKDDPDWTDEQHTQLNQISLLDTEANPAPLRKVPYKIYCHFECNDPNCKGHRLLLTSWEYNWTFLTLLDKERNDAQAAIKELNKRWMEQFSDTRLGYLMLGTVNSQDRFHTFIVIGHCSFVKKHLEQGEQMSLF